MVLLAAGWLSAAGWLAVAGSVSAAGGLLAAGWLSAAGGLLAAGWLSAAGGLLAAGWLSAAGGLLAPALSSTCCWKNYEHYLKIMTIFAKSIYEAHSSLGLIYGLYLLFLLGTPPPS